LEDERPPLVVMPGDWRTNNDIINKINTQKLSGYKFESPAKPKEFLAFLMNQKAVKIREAHLALDSHKIVFFEDFKEEETRAATAKAEKEKTQEVEQQKDNYILEGFKEIHKFENEEERVRNEKAKVMKTENLKGLDEHIFFKGPTLDGIPDEFHAKVAKIKEITGVENLPDNEKERELAISKFQKRFGFDKPVSYKYLFWKKPYKKESFGKETSGSRGAKFVLPASETNASGGIWGRQLKKLLDGTWSDDDEFKFSGDWRYMYVENLREEGGVLTPGNTGCCDVCGYCGVNAPRRQYAPITDFFVINSGFWVCKNRNDDGEPCWLGLVEEIEKKGTLNKMKDALTKWKNTRNVSHIKKLNEYKEELLAYIDKYDSLSEDKYSILQEVNKAIKEGSVSQTASLKEREELKMGKATFGFPGGRRRRKKTVKRRKTKRTKKRKTKRRKKKKRKSNRRK